MDSVYPISGGAIVLGAGVTGYGISQALEVKRLADAGAKDLHGIAMDAGSSMYGIYADTKNAIDSGVVQITSEASGFGDRITQTDFGGPFKAFRAVRQTQQNAHVMQNRITNQVDATRTAIMGSLDAGESIAAQAAEQLQSRATKLAADIKAPAVRALLAERVGSILVGAGVAAALVGVSHTIDAHRDAVK